MKNAKQKSITVIALFLVLTLIGGYIAAIGVGTQSKGKASHILLGLDLAGGVSITYEVKGKTPSEEDLKDTIYRIQKRVDTYSTEGSVYQEGNRRINVEIPGVTNANEILEELGKPGALTFMGMGVEKESETVLDGSDVADADGGAITDPATGLKGYAVDLTLTKAGAAKFKKATEKYLTKQIAIIYDNQIISAPTVNSVIKDGKAQITGMSSFEEVDKLATTIRIGALPLELTEVQSKVVSAQLGKDAIQTSLKAGAIGLVLVCIFMMAVYLLPGVVASFALIAYVILMLLALNGFNITLTLPGIAGIILSIGMAVDANVIIFTRIREEITAGKSVRSSIRSGFDKALSAILDGNITTLIAAAILYVKGTGSIKGFATTLAIGILLSMFTALVITKLLLNAAYSLGMTNEKFYGKSKPLKVRNYVKASRLFAILSIVVVALGIVFLPINKSNIGDILNYSLEFKGGTATTITFEKGSDLNQLEEDVTNVFAKETGESVPQIQKVPDANQMVVKTSGQTLDQREAVSKALKDDLKAKEVEAQNISANISNEMKQDAVVSVIIAAVCILIYVAFRFKDVKFGASAVLALLHDVLVVFTIYSVARLSVGNTFIACMLTIVGYSINATIIIFDRIRENLRIMSVRRDGLEAIVNTSISQTFTRTINTSLTTFIMVFVLYIMGVPSIKEFAITLMAGIICGAYSSVCITSPLWYFLKIKFGKNVSALPAGNSKVENKTETVDIKEQNQNKTANANRKKKKKKR